MKIMIPDEALKKHIAILGMNGSGKTSVAKSQIVEPALKAGRRVCAIDPTGVWWGLRLKDDSKSPAFKIYIVGGEKADFPLERRDGKAWAEIVGTSSDSFIFDTSLMTVQARSEWFTAFAETLIRKNKGPLNFVLDEAHLFAPQSGATGGGIAPMMLHATNNLLSLGRSKGLRITMISQRPAKLHKDSLSQAHSLIAMMVTSPQDRGAIKAWISDQADEDLGARIIASLSTLAPGEGWLWAPREKVLERMKFPWPKTFDSSSAPDEDAGEAVTLKPIDPAEITEKLAVVAKETVANDPAKLRAEVARLTAELKKAPQNITEKITADPEAELRGYQRGEAETAPIWFRRGGESVMNHIKNYTQKIDLYDLLKTDMEGWKKVGALPATKAKPVPRAAPTVVPKSASYVKPATPISDDARPLGAERKPLAVLASVHPAGMTDGQWRAAAVFKKSGTWSTYLSRLRQSGRIEERGGLYFASEQGIADLGGEVNIMPPPGMDLVEFWISKINGIGPMLRRLAEIYPQKMTKDQLREELGMKAGSGTFSTYLSRLRTPGLIEIDSEKNIGATAELMGP